MDAKNRHKKKMLEYWSNPANDFITRSQMRQKVLHLSDPTFYKHFPPDELTAIEHEAEAERRKRYSRERAEVIQAMYMEGKSGNVSAAKEFLDRVEGKVVIPNEHTGKDGGAIKLENSIIEFVEAVKK